MKKILHLGVLFLSFHAPAQTTLSNACLPATAQVDLDINNVRALIVNSGAQWFGGNYTSGYEVPKGSGKNSIFAGGLWLGGLSANGQLKVAAMTYRQTGDDFWPGPLDSSGHVETNTCWQYDRIWKVNRAEVESFIENRSDPEYIVPEVIRTWPGNGNTARGEAPTLAPFSDVDGDGIYDYTKGDFPGFSPDPNNNQCNYHLQGDQSLWWVFNDRGDAHGETGGVSMGVEIQATAYAFNRNDDMGNTTFYRYHIINRSNERLSQCWLGLFTDVDLGDAFDDYVGCDVSRNVAYVYNGMNNDGGQAYEMAGTYGAHPPSLGVDILRGPSADANDLLDNDRDGLVDEGNEFLHMERFKYYDNNTSTTGYPSATNDFYHYLQGKWKDGTMQTYGGNGNGGAQEAWYMFPDNSDPDGWGTNGIPQQIWTEITAGNMYSDRRFLSSAGPFTLEPGQVQTLHTSVVWTRDMDGTPLDNRDKMLAATDRVQAIFDNCFAGFDCTTAGEPRVFHQQENTKVWFALEAGKGTYSWTFGDGQTSTERFPKHHYTKAGTYFISVAVSNLCGIKWAYDTIQIITIDENLYGPVLKRVEGSGGGSMWLEFTNASVDSLLRWPEARIMQPSYEPVAAPVRVIVDPDGNFTEGDFTIALDTVGLKARWKVWKNNSTDTVYAEHTIANQNRQYIPQWGIYVETRELAFPGDIKDNNGFLGSSLSFSDPTKNWLTGIAHDKSKPSNNNWIRSGKMDFQSSQSACINAFNSYKVSGNFIDPNNVYETVVNGTWAPYRLASKTPAYSSACYTAGPALDYAPSQGVNKMRNLASVNIVFTADKSKWSRCPVVETGPSETLNEGGVKAFSMRQHLSVDKNGKTVLNGGLSDPTNPEAADYIGATGMGWFPGYAYNLETGERLNLLFGENSAMAGENGRDMLWNPTSNAMSNLGDPIWGGMHYVYVLGHNSDLRYSPNFSTADLQNELRDIPRYDAGFAAWKILNSSSEYTERGEIYRDAMWVNIPLLAQGHSLLETDATVRLRVSKPFKRALAGPVALNDTCPMFTFSLLRSEYSFLPFLGEPTVFPNPFAESCTIMFENPADKPVHLRVYDMRGTLVRDMPDLRTDRVAIDRRGLENGVYLYELVFDDGQRKTGRFIAR